MVSVGVDFEHNAGLELEFHDVVGQGDVEDIAVGDGEGVCPDDDDSVVGEVELGVELGFVVLDDEGLLDDKPLLVQHLNLLVLVSLLMYFNDFFIILGFLQALVI